MSAGAPDRDRRLQIGAEVRAAREAHRLGMRATVIIETGITPGEMAHVENGWSSTAEVRAKLGEYLSGDPGAWITRPERLELEAAGWGFTAPGPAPPKHGE